MIDEHKWYLSEKAGRDVGYKAAMAEWFRKYGEQYLKGCERSHCISCGFVFREDLRKRPFNSAKIFQLI